MATVKPKQKNKKSNKRSQSKVPKLFGRSLNLQLLSIVSIMLMFGSVGVHYAFSSSAATNAVRITGIAGKCLDNNRNRRVDYNKIQLYSCNSTGAQKWIVHASATLAGTIVNNNGYCLDVYHDKTSSGTPVDLFKCNGTPAQYWLVNSANKTITNPHSGLCLDDKHAGTTNGNQIWVYHCNGTAAQQWTVGNVAPGGGTTGGGSSSGGGGNSSGGGGSSTGGGGSSSGSGTYTVVGNKILNSSGKTMLLHGVDRPSLEWSCNGQSVTGGPGPIPASDFTTMKNSWNANAVRIALDQDFWLPGAARYCSSYQSNVATAVKDARAAGLIVILDLHWSDQGNLADANPGQQCMADKNSATFWQQVASQYKTDPNVWFELYNEPENIPWSVWQNGGSVCGFNAVGMQQLYNSVRSTGAQNIVLAGGIQWSSVLNGVPKLSGNNIAYAIHIYRMTAGSSWSTGGWDYQFGTTSAQVPVVSTEFGDQVCDGQPFDQQLLSYFHAHNVGYTGWAWYAGGCKFPSLISNAAGTCSDAGSSCAIQKDMKNYPAQ